MSAGTHGGPEHPSSHLLAVPVSDEELCEVTAQFLAAGLAAGERVSYYDDGTADAVLARLHDDGVELHAPLRSGQFRLVPAEVTRTALLAPLDELSGLLEGDTAAALADGWAGLRFTGQMSHGLTRPGGPVLDEYDRIVDRVVRGGPVHALCVYDRARYPDRLIARMRRVHPAAEATLPLHDDGLLRITGRGAALRLAGEVDHSNRPQVRRVLGRVVDRLVRETGGGVLVADLASLRFCDVAAAVSVVHAAEELPVTVRLRLTGVRPRVARLLERCGAAFAPQLDVVVRAGRPLTTADALGLATGDAA